MISLQVTEKSVDKTVEFIHDAEVYLDLKYKMIRFLGLVDGEPYWEVSMKDSWVIKPLRKVVKVVQGFKVQTIVRKIRLARIQEKSQSESNAELKKELLKYQVNKGYKGLERLLELKTHYYKSIKQ